MNINHQKGSSQQKKNKTNIFWKQIFLQIYILVKWWTEATEKRYSLTSLWEAAATLSHTSFMEIMICLVPRNWNQKNEDAKIFLMENINKRQGIGLINAVKVALTNLAQKTWHDDEKRWWNQWKRKKVTLKPLGLTEDWLFWLTHKFKKYLS